MLISILSVSVEALEMSYAEAAKALAPRAWDLKPDNLLRLNPDLAHLDRPVVTVGEPLPETLLP